MRVEPFLGSAVGEYQDSGRADVPEGFVWGLKDFVPYLLGAAIRGRGGWAYASGALSAPVDAMIYATYVGGGTLIAAAGAQAWRIPISGVGNDPLGAINPMSKQNPVFYQDRVYFPSRNNTTRFLDGSFTMGDVSGASAFKGQYGTVFRERLVIASNDAQPDYVWFSPPSALPTTAWNAQSWQRTNGKLTGIFGMRNQLLCFHDDFVEQIRGTEPPDSSRDDPLGDFTLGLLWDRAGCFDARSIAAWRENVLFADTRGVHITDGGIVRNLIEQGGMAGEWRGLFQRGGTVEALAGCMYGNLYVCTVRFAAGASPSETWVCDVPTRRWYRWLNIRSSAYAVTSGTLERLFGTDHTASRVINMDGCLNPNATILQVDGDGVPVLPEVETGWQRLSKRVGFRRWYDMFLHYLAYQATDPGVPLVNAWLVEHPEETTLAEYKTLGNFRQAVDSRRRKIPIYRQSEGIGLMVKAAVATNDFRIHSIGASVETLEEHRV